MPNRQFFVCFAFVALLVAIAPLAHVVAAFPGYRSAVFALGLVALAATGAIALIQFRADGRARSAVLAVTYLFCLPLFFAALIVFPGVIPEAFLGNGGNATPWFYVAAVVAFILGGFAYAFAGQGNLSRRYASWILPAALFLSAACAVGVWLLVALLPIGAKAEVAIPGGIDLAVCALWAAGIFSLLRSPGKDQAGLWFTTAQFLAFLGLIAILLNPLRYSIPWYFDSIALVVAFWCVPTYFIRSGYARYGAVVTSVDELIERADDEQIRFERTVNSAAIGIAHIDHDGRAIFANDRLCQMLGKPPGVLARMPSILDLLESVTTLPSPNGMQTALEGKLRKEDGSERWLEVWSTPAPEGNYSIAVVNDVTARKNAEDALVRLNEIKSQFIATMSHEIRTPLSGIVGVSELFKRTTPLTEKQRRFAETIDSSSQTLLQLVNDVLDFSKIEASKLELQRTFFDLLGVVDSIRDVFAPEAARKAIHFFADAAPSLAGGLYGDPVRLRQILDNLLSNAVKFTNAGHVLVSASEVETNGSAVLVRFRVEDTGPGIPLEEQARIFEAFSQGDASTARYFGGTGLGLAIVKRLVELMGGGIAVESEPGRGSTFSFDLWFERELQGQRLDVHSTRLRGLRVFVFTGDDASRFKLERRLFAWGMHIDSDLTPQLDCVILDGSDPGAEPFLESVRNDPRLDNVKAVFAAVGNRAFSASALYDTLVGACLAEGDSSLDGATRLGFVPPRGERILVAEDNDVNRMLVLAQLEELGFAADFVEDGAAAIAAAETGLYSLILMDSQMPNVDGLEATAAIRKREAASSRHMPIVCMTANASKNYRDTCLAAGMDDYISKPVLLATLQSTLERWLAPVAS